jgi:hypothetical protein
MDAQAIEQAAEPRSCPLCDSGAARLIVECWSDEDDPDASYHIACLKCGCNGSQRDAARGGAGMEPTVGVGVGA